MKKALLLGLLALPLSTIPVLAQKSKVTSAFMYLRHDELDKAKQAIDEASTNAETKDDPKTWLYRGNVYTAISLSKNSAFQKLADKPVSEAISAYGRSISLDAKDRYSEEAGDSLTNIALREYNVAVNKYSSQNYEGSLESFNHFFNAYNSFKSGSNKLAGMMATFNPPLMIDNVKLVMASAAEQAGKKDVAMKMYQELVDDSIKEASVYTSLADMYRQAGDTAKALAVVDKGLAHLDDKKTLLIDKLNMYIQQGQSQKAIELGKQAIAADPKNASIYIAMGNIYDYKLNMSAEAQDMYNKAIALDPDNFNVNYSLGASFFNQGAAVYNQSVNEKDYAKAGKLEDQAKEVWKKALPYMEKAHALKPEDKDVLNVLAEIYAKLGDFEKSKKYRDMIKK